MVRWLRVGNRLRATGGSRAMRQEAVVVTLSSMVEVRTESWRKEDTKAPILDLC